MLTPFNFLSALSVPSYRSKIKTIIRWYRHTVLLTLSQTAFPFHFIASVVGISSFPLNTQARINRQAAFEKALQISMRRQQSFLLCSQFTGMLLACFSGSAYLSPDIHYCQLSQGSQLCLTLFLPCVRCCTTRGGK